MSEQKTSEVNIEPKEKTSNLQWWILVTVIVGTFLGRLDQTIVNLALPKIIIDFGINVSSAGWIATAYILANAIFVPIWGKLGDTIGRKKVYIIGFSVFILGSVLAGLAWNLSSMIAFRIIQAIAGSADYPTAMAILAVTFKDSKARAHALGLWSASFAAASVFGPLIGGPLIDNFGWRSVFLVNLPVGIIGLIMAMKFINESVSERKTTKFDWSGAITLGATLSSLVLVLDKGLDWGWFSINSILCYISIIVFGIIFTIIERGHEEPIVDFKFFKISAFVNTLGNNAIVFMGMMGGIFLVPLFAQSFLGLDATQTGILFIPMAVCMVIAAQIGGRLIGRIDPRYVIAASTFTAGIGIYCLSFLDPRSTSIAIMIPLSIMAFGMGFGMAQRTNIIATVVPQNEIGVASSILALVRNISGAFGIALFSTILTETIKNNVLKIAHWSTINSHNPLDFKKAAALIILKSEVSAYDKVFIIASILLFLGAITALWIKVSKKEMEGVEEVLVE